MELYEIIRIHRTRRGLKQSEVAEMIGLKSSAYSKIEAGRTEVTINRLISIFIIFGDEFFNDVLVYIHEKSILEIAKRKGTQDIKIVKAEDMTEEQANIILKKSVSYRTSIIKSLISKD